MARYGGRVFDDSVIEEAAAKDPSDRPVTLAIHYDRTMPITSGAADMTTIAEVESAENKLLEVSKQQPDWSPKELRQAARNSRNGHNGLPREVVSLAFWRLLTRGALQMDEKRRVHRPTTNR